ncbi:MAG: hypothetical protein MZV65_25590 [Chromatiales bacterium]|nr:hypothetical protein [Chromatiales bacterium]
MKQLIAISAIGSDRTGLVYDLTRVVVDCGGNILESRMTALGNEFAMLHAGRAATGTRSPSSRASSPSSAKPSGLTITSRRTEPRPPRADMVSYTVDVVCLDQPGVLHALAGFFSSRGIDIGDITTRSYSAAAHRRPDVLRVHGGARADPHPHRRAARGIPRPLRPPEPRRHPRTAQVVRAPWLTRPPRSAARSPTSPLPATRRQAVEAVRRPAGKLGRLLLSEGQHLGLHPGRRRTSATCTRSSGRPAPTSSASRPTALASHEKFKAKYELPVRAARRRPRRPSAQLFDVVQGKEHVRQEVHGRRAQHVPARRARACCAGSGARSRSPGHADEVLRRGR